MATELTPQQKTNMERYEAERAAEEAAHTELLRSMTGRVIVSVVCEDANPGIEWTGHEEYTVILDDGRRVVFGAWGYDAWGATIRLDDGSGEYSE